MTESILQTLPPSANSANVTRLYGYLNYEGGNSNFFIPGISTGQKLHIALYSIQEGLRANAALYGWGTRSHEEPSQVEPIRQVTVSDYGYKNRFTEVLTVPRYADLTDPPHDSDVEYIELSADGPTAFFITIL